MDWDAFAPMVVLLTLILTAGGVLLLRPLTKRLGDLVQVMAEERRLKTQPQGAELGQLRDVLESINARLALLEERQDFTDQLISATRQKALDASASESGLGADL